MTEFFCRSALVFFAIYPVTLPAETIQHGKQHLEMCMQKALAVHAGRVIKVEMKTEDQAMVYEFDIRDRQGMDWDVECDADSGEIIEIEKEVSTLISSKYNDRVRFSEKQARKTALEKFPGEIIEIEYEIEDDGRVVYEFDIRLDAGGKMKVEVDAATGKIHEADRELWQIGYE